MRSSVERKPTDFVGLRSEAQEKSERCANGGGVSANENSAELFFDWTQVECMDLHEYVRRLRAIHCTEESIQDLVVGKVNRQFAERAAKIRKLAAPPYWQTVERRTRTESQNASQIQQLRQELEKDRRGLLSDLLGLTVNPSEENATVQDRLSHFLDLVSEGTQPRVKEILHEFSVLESGVIDRCGGTLGMNEQVEMKRLYGEKLNRLRNVLSAAELEEFELRESPLAHRLRTADLVGFSPNEREFRTIFEILNVEEGSADGGSATAQARLRETLGEARYVDYQRCKDWTFRRLVEFASHYGLEPTAAIQVHSMRETAIRQADALHRSGRLSTLARETVLIEMTTEAVRAVREVLGEHAYPAYAASELGRWIALLPTWTNGVAFRE